MRAAAAVVAVVVLLASSVATAQPSLTPPSTPEQQPSGAPKDPGVALAWSLGVTVGGIALISIATALEDSGQSDGVVGSLAVVGTIGLLVGPTTGHWYAGRYAHTATGVRLGGLAVGTVGFFMLMGCIFSESDDCDAGGALFLLGSLTHTVGTIWEISAAPGSARRYNRRHGLDLQIAPAPMAGGAGVVLGGAF